MNYDDSLVNNLLDIAQYIIIFKHRKTKLADYDINGRASWTPCHLHVWGKWRHVTEIQETVWSNVTKALTPGNAWW